MRLPEQIRVGGTDEVDLNICAVNSHDGSSAFRVMVTPVRVVCANTLHAALHQHRSSWSVRHTPGATNAVQEARESLRLTFAWAGEFEAEAERLANQTTTDAEFFALVDDLFGTPDAGAPARSQNAYARRTSTLAHLWADAPTQNGVTGTAWGAYQAVAEYLDHCAPVRDSRDPAGARAARVLTSAEPAQLKDRAWAALAG